MLSMTTQQKVSIPLQVTQQNAQSIESDIKDWPHKKDSYLAVLSSVQSGRFTAH